MSVTIGFIGFGLIGGSMARRYRELYPDAVLMAYSRTKDTLYTAREDGVLDLVLDQIDTSFSACDYIFLCTPVSYHEMYLNALKPFISPDCILSDVGSTKTEIHEAVIRLELERQFVGGHPMAGSERTGYAQSNNHLFENAYYVLTPTAYTRENQLAKMKHFASDLGALPLVLSYEAHDYIVGAVSHLPHVIAASLVNLVADSDDSMETMKRVAAGGFKDITRIASSSPEMWEQICLSNQVHLSTLLRAYIHSLEDTLRDLKDGNAARIYDLFERSGTYRNSISETGKGSLTPEYAVYCDIDDKAGAIATIATTLAIHQISIKNIGIIHNREFEQGVLKIEFYEKTACEEAAVLLTACHYQVYPR